MFKDMLSKYDSNSVNGILNQLKKDSKPKKKRKMKKKYYQSMD
jgi:hypothetical protein